MRALHLGLGLRSGFASSAHLCVCVCVCECELVSTYILMLLLRIGGIMVHFSRSSSLLAKCSFFGCVIVSSFAGLVSFFVVFLFCPDFSG